MSFALISKSKEDDYLMIDMCDNKESYKMKCQTYVKSKYSNYIEEEWEDNVPIESCISIYKPEGGIYVYYTSSKVNIVKINTMVSWLISTTNTYDILETLLMIPTRQSKLEQLKMDVYDCCVKGNVDKLKSYYEMDHLIISLKNFPNTKSTNHKNSLEEFENNDVISTLLFVAVQNGHLECVKFIHEHDPTQLDVQDNSDRTALYMASYIGYLDIVKYIYECNPLQIDISTVTDCTPFYASCYNGHLEIAKYLFKCKPTIIGIQNANNCTPFYASAVMGHLECLKFIREYDSSQIDIVNSKGCSPFYASCYGGHFEVVEYLFECKPYWINIPNKHGCTPFYATACKGHVKCAQFIHDRNPLQIGIVNSDDFTPLDVCCYNGFLDFVKFILEKCPEQLYLGSPYYYSCKQGNLNISNYLYSLDPNVLKGFNKH